MLTEYQNLAIFTITNQVGTISNDDTVGFPALLKMRYGGMIIAS